ncbi:MAG TPA: PAS domain S-box protein [Planctomycetota bacterium]|nr:PAS domain S-box protein [Planctomycetota bacterium]
MIRVVRDLPIRRKIILIILTVVGIALVLQRTVIYFSDLQSSRNNIRADMISLAEIISANSEAAMVFNDPRAVGHTLQSLRLNPVILAASIYNQDGKLFAGYSVENQNVVLPETAQRDGVVFEGDQLKLFHPMILDNKRIGTVYLLVDLRPMYQQLNRSNAIAFVIVVVVFLFALILSSLMQRLVSRPILALAETARQVSEKKDYSLRAQKSSDDELGVLIDGFNDMLSQIEAREAALRESQRRVTLLVQETPLGVIVFDTQFTVLEWNKAAERIFGYTEGEIAGKSGRCIMPEDSWNMGGAAVWTDLLRNAGGRRSIHTNIRKDGRRIICDWYNTALADDSGKIIGVAAMVDDITDRKRAEDEIQKLNEQLELRVRERTSQLEAANKELEAFAYSVSHDLRAPLRAIDGFSQLIEAEYAERLDVRGRDYLRRVREATQRMGQLIDDMLTLSRVSRSEMKREPIDLSEMVQLIIDDLREREPQRRVEVVITPGIQATGDPRLVRIMLENLIGNAWKFTSRKADGRIEFGETTRDGKNIFYVKDNGAGFDMSYANRLFTAFQRLHTASEFPGTGVGLAIVHRVVLRHSGCIWAEGEVDKGATFSFTL